MPQRKQPLFKNVAIIGVGLLGGSIGLALRKRKLAKRVIGVARPLAARRALKRKAVHAVLPLAQAVSAADLVILSAHVSTIKKHLAQIKPLLRPGTVVCDVGSSKQEIDRTAKRTLKRNVFVGCHPMAGAAESGVTYANADLFEAHIVFMTQKHARLRRWWASLGAKPVYITAQTHDRWVAQASHLPHILSFALLQTFKGKHPHVTINPSLREFSRLAKSNPQLWSDILLSNQEQIDRALTQFTRLLNAWRKAVRTRRQASLESFITQAQRNAHRLKEF